LDIAPIEPVSTLRKSELTSLALKIVRNLIGRQLTDGDGPDDQA
jgi:hypothetical protein